MDHLKAARLKEKCKYCTRMAEDMKDCKIWLWEAVKRLAQTDQSAEVPAITTNLEVKTAD